jgi:hypothetical protein
LDESLLCSAVSKYLGHFPEGLIEFHILIDALDCPALGHPATVRAAARTVALTTANDVFLDAVQRATPEVLSIKNLMTVKKRSGLSSEKRVSRVPADKTSPKATGLILKIPKPQLACVYVVISIEIVISVIYRALNCETKFNPCRVQIA